MHMASRNTSGNSISYDGISNMFSKKIECSDFEKMISSYNISRTKFSPMELKLVYIIFDGLVFRWNHCFGFRKRIRIITCTEA